MGSWELLDHTADVRLSVRGDDLVDFFITAACALTELLVGPNLPGATERLTIRAEGGGPEEVLVDWLRELLYRFQGEGRIAVEHDIIEMTNTGLTAECGFSPFDPERMSVATDIKAITYHDLEVVKNDRGVHARIVCDV